MPQQSEDKPDTEGCDEKLSSAAAPICSTIGPIRFHLAQIGPSAPACKGSVSLLTVILVRRHAVYAACGDQKVGVTSVMH